MMKYIEPLFRPPAEANSLIFQVAYGCPHNTCKFCGMYKGVRYETRNIDDVLKEIYAAGKAYPETRRVFLADGDVMIMEYENLYAIVKAVNKNFPKLTRINTYANGSSILTKTDEQLLNLRKEKLTTLYLGLETGSQELLNQVCKAETVDDMIAGVSRGQKLGFKCSVMVLLGLGGKEQSNEHALATAKALNQMQPQLLSALRFIEVPGSKMFDGYQSVSEYDAVVELRTIINYLDLPKTVFTANHASNPIPLKGRFPKDKPRLLMEIESMLKSGVLDKKGPGRVPMWL